MIRGRGRKLWVAACIVLLALPAAGAEPTAKPDPVDPAAGPATEPGDWKFSLAVYGWLTDVTGTVTARDASVDVDPQLWHDIIENLDGALMGAVEAEYRGRWLVNLDLVGAGLSDHLDRGPFPVSFGPRSFSRELGSADLSLPVETRLGTLDVPIRVDPGTLRVDVPRVATEIGPFDIDVKTLMIFTKAQVGYRVVDMPALQLLGQTPGSDTRRFRVDLFAGIRYWYLKTKIEIDSPPIRVPEFKVTSSLSGGRVRVGGSRIPPQTVALPTVHLPGVQFGGTTFGGTNVDQTESSWWIDPLIGVRFGADLTERVSMVLAGNVGGFDIGSASQFSWEGLAYLDWRFGETTSFALGYRGLGLDRKKGDAQADIILHGPLLGFIFRF